MSQKQSDTAPPSSTNRTALRTGTVGVAGLVLFVMSAQAPMTAIAGASPIAIGLGNGPGAPAAFLVIGIVIAIFAVGFIAMSRRLGQQGAFFAYIGAGLGRRAGVGAGWLALLTYGTIQAAMYGLLSFSASQLIGSFTGVFIPWWVYVIVVAAFVHFLGTRNLEVGARVLVVLVGMEFAIILIFAVTVLLRGGGPSGLDIAGSFSPAALFSGAPGVAIMFAVASMFGFEQTAIYSGEARDPRRTIARASYISVAIISIFYAFTMWMLVAYYGADRVVPIALNDLAKGDGPVFLYRAMNAVLGEWASVIASILLITSLLAGIIAFHNCVNRYLHALGSANALPKPTARTNRHGAPHIAAWIQTTAMLVTILPFAALRLDPVLTLFSWLSGLAVLALLVLYFLTSIAVIRYFRGHADHPGVWQGVLAPAVAAVLVAGVLAVVIYNFNILIGGSWETAGFLMAVVPVAVVVGLLVERSSASRSTGDVSSSITVPGPERATAQPPTLEGEG